MTSLIDRYRRWFDYEQDAHAKVVASLRTVPEDQRANASYQKALDLLAHIAAARSLWLYRFGAWNDYLSSLDDDALGRVVTYRAIEGGRFQNRIEDLLAQLFGHSWYHRGQIASIVPARRSLGGEPAVTDFVYWSRTSVDAD